MYRAIIFDMDDTLIQTKVAKFAAHKHAAKHFYDLDITDTDIALHWGKPFPTMVAGIYGDVDPLETILDKYYSISANFPIHPYDGAEELIGKLALTYPLGLLTAANHRLMVSAMDDAEISTTYFTYIQTSDDTSYHKPDPQVFLPALAHFGRQGINHHDILYVGDSIEDLRAARGAGIDFVGIAGHTTDQSVFAGAHAKFVINLSSLLDFL